MSYIKVSFAIALVALLVSCGSAPTQDSSKRSNKKLKAVEVPAAAKEQYKTVLAVVEQKDWSSAENQLVQMQAQYPKLSSVKAMLGWVYWQSGKTEQAAAYLEGVVEQGNIYKADAYNYLAVIYREQGQFKAAEKLYLEALETWPEDFDLHKNLGILYDLYLNQLPKALEHYQQALALNKKDKRLKGWVKDLQRRTEKGRKK